MNAPATTLNVDVDHRLVGQILHLNGQAWLIIGKEEWGNYVVLENEDGETIIRSIGTVSRTLELEALNFRTK